MAANPGIYSLVQGPKDLPNPLAQAGQVMQIKNLMGAGKFQDLQTRASESELEYLPRKRELAEAAATRAANLDALNQQKLRAEVYTKNVGIMRDLTAQAASDADMPVVKEMAFRLFGPEVAAQVPTQFSPEWKLKGIQTADSLIQQIRDAQQQAVTVRGQDLSAQTARRGQDISAETARAGQEVTRRGQDMSAETTRRGQDLVDRRERDPELARNLAAAKEFGKAGAESAMALPDVIAKGQQGMQLIDRMLGTEGKELKPGEERIAPHPGFFDYVGSTWKPGARYIPGSAASDFEAMYKQITGQAFLQAFQSLKGGGHITEIEGQKGTEAITRMNSSQSEPEFIKAAREFQEIIRNGMERARTKASAATPSSGGGGAGIKFLGFEP